MPTIEQPSAGIGHNSGSVATLLADTHAALVKQVDDLKGDVKKFRLSLGETPSIETDEQFDTAVKHGKDARALESLLDRTKLDTTKPLRDEVAATNSFFDSLKDHAAAERAGILKLVDDFNKRKKEREAREAAEAARRAQEEAKRKLEEAQAAEHSVVSDIALKEAVTAEKVAQRMEHRALNAGSGPTRTAAGTVSTTSTWDFQVIDWSKIDLRELRDSFSVAEIEKAIRAHVRKNKNTRPLAGVDIFQKTGVALR